MEARCYSLLRLMQMMVWGLGFSFTMNLTAATIPLSESRNEIHIGQRILFLEDAEKKFDLAALRNLSLDDWSQSSSTIPTFGFTKSRYWLHFHVKNEEETSLQRILELEYSHYDSVDFFLVKNGEVQTYTMGDLLPFQTRLVDYRNFLLPFSLDAGAELTFFISLETSGPLFFPVNIWNPIDFGAQKTAADHVAGYYYGILLAMFGYNLFLFLTTFKRLFLYYVFYTAGFFFFQYSLHGFAFDFLWPNAPWWANNCVAFFQAFALFWVTVFTINFLDADKNLPKFRYLLWLILAGSVATIFLSLFASYSIAIRLGTVFSLIGAIICLAAGILVLMRGYRPANFYVLAFITFLIGIMINSLKQLGVIEQSFFSEYAIQMGSALEMILLSIAVGDKIRIEQKMAHQAIRQLNGQLKELNEHLEERVVEKTRDIKSILENIPQGIFQIKLVNGLPVIDDEVSSYITTLIPNIKLVGTDPVISIFDSSNLSTNDLSMLRSVLETSIQAPLMQFDINKHVLPREIKLGNRLIEVDWSPILNDLEDIDKILVTLKDVTEIRSLQLKSIEQAQEFAKLGEVARHDAEKMLGFFTICTELFRSSIRNLNSNGSNNALVFRNLHTIKGLARNFQFQTLTESVHEAEQILKDNQNKSIDSKLFQEIREKIDSSIEIFKEYERINNKVLGRQNTQDQVVVQRKDLEEIHNLISHASAREDIREVETKILFLFESRLEQVIADEVNLLYSLCQKLGKPIPTVKYLNDKFIIPTDKKSLLRKIFVHLLRNSIDHGIETEEVRLAANKSPEGNIICSMSEIDNGVKINYRDDGRGLNLIKIREQGLQKGFIKPGVEHSAKDIANLIFEAGFSTAAAVTEISGRGVGMDAVRNFLLESGSNITISLDSDEINDHVPFSFDISLDLFAFDKQAEAI